MLFISHRGNLDGFNPERENSEDYISEAMEKQYNVMVDVWLVGGSHPALGNNHARYPISLEFLQKEGIICRARTLQTLQYLLDNKTHCFYQDYERTSLTSKGFIWTTDNSQVVPRSIYHLPENHVTNIEDAARLNCMAVCSNFIQKVSGRLDDSSSEDTSNDSSEETEEVLKNKEIEVKLWNV